MTEEELERIKDIDFDIRETKNFLENLQKMQGVDCLSCINRISVEHKFMSGMIRPFSELRYKTIKNDTPKCLHSELSAIIKAEARKLAEKKLSELKRDFEQIKITTNK